MGASILPITVHNGKILFLFGKERNIDENPGWSDFGGGTDNNETFIETASREGAEEITGFLGEKNDIKKMLRKYGTFNIDYEDPLGKYGTYRCHICPIDYDEYLTKYYNNNQKFLQKHLSKKIIRDMKIFEKTEIKWFSFDEMQKNKNHFRKFYQKIVNLILKNKKNIIKFIFSKRQFLKKNKTIRTKPIRTKPTHNRKTKKRKP
jgi:hypothetical protein